MESYDNIPNGCDKHDNCETCPFDHCRASSCSGKRGYIRERHKRVLHLAWNKVPTNIIAQRTGLSLGSVERVIRENS